MLYKLVNSNESFPMIVYIDYFPGLGINDLPMKLFLNRKPVNENQINYSINDLFILFTIN